MHEVYFNIPLGVGPASDYSIWRANSYLGLTSSCGLTPMKWGKTRGGWDSKPAQTETSLLWRGVPIVSSVGHAYMILRHHTAVGGVEPAPA